MKLRSLGILISILMMSTTAFADGIELSSGERLRKLSLLLTGQMPSAEEVRLMNRTADKETFFREQAKRYVSSPLFNEKFLWRSKDVLRLDQSPVYFSKEYKRSDNSQLNKLVADQARWSDILLSPGYAYEEQIKEAEAYIRRNYSNRSLVVAYKVLYSMLQQGSREERLKIIREYMTHARAYPDFAISKKDPRSSMPKIKALVEKWNVDVKIDLDDLKTTEGIKKESDAAAKGLEMLRQKYADMKTKFDRATEDYNDEYERTSYFSLIFGKGPKRVTAPDPKLIKADLDFIGVDYSLDVLTNLQDPLSKYRTAIYRDLIVDYDYFDRINGRRSREMTEEEQLNRQLTYDKEVQSGSYDSECASGSRYEGNRSCDFYVKYVSRAPFFPRFPKLLDQSPEALNLYLDIVEKQLADIETASSDRNERPEIKISAEQLKALDAVIVDSGRKVWANNGFKGGALSLILSADLDRRYTQTKFSKSAAVMRLFFCDEMKLVALAKGNELSQIAITQLNGKKGMTTVADTTVDERHASEARCQTCHRKLDPIQNLANSGGNITEAKTFVYDDELGVEHKFTSANNEDFINQVVAQPQFLTCQTRRFWNWYIGNDIPLAGPRLDQMTTLYKNDKSIQDLVVDLVSQPEFSRIPKLTDMVTFEMVRPIFHNCNSCHKDTLDAPDLSKPPFNFYGDASEHFGVLQKVVASTDLFHSGAQAKMPKAEANWPQDQIQDATLQIGRWLMASAPNSQGQPTITKAQRDQLLAGASQEFLERATLPDANKPAFRTTWKRYLEGEDFIRVLSQTFAMEPGRIDTSSCFRNFLNQNAAFGWTEPLSGSPTVMKPERDFQVAWARCVSEFFTKKLGLKTTDEGGRSSRRDSDSDSEKAKILELVAQLVNQDNAVAKETPIPDDMPFFNAARLEMFKQRFVARNQDFNNISFKTVGIIQLVKWNGFTPAERQEIADALTDSVYSPGIFSTNVRTRIADELLKTLNELDGKTTMSMMDAARTAFMLLMSREEFLTI